jgi:putative oxidoreductase
MTGLLFSSQKKVNAGIFLVRVVTGVIILKYGLQVFDKVQIGNYTQWLSDIHFPLPRLMTYVGKATEFIGSILLIIGLFTRLSSIILVIDMLVVTFVMGKANLFGDEQGSFLLMLLFLTFLFIGAGKWSIDYYLLDKNNMKN